MWSNCALNEIFFLHPSDMEAAGKQTFIVEVMPLTGGHLALPKVRLSKYILPKNSSTAPANINPALEATQNGVYLLIGVMYCNCAINSHG